MTNTGSSTISYWISLPVNEEVNMLRKLLPAFLLSLGFNLVVMLINYISFIKSGHLKFCFKMFGGEITIEHGFGLMMRHIYAMRPDASDSISLRFSLINFILFVLVFTVLFAVIGVVFRLIRSK